MQKNEKFSLRTQKTTFECGRANLTRAEDSKHNFKFRWPKSGADVLKLTVFLNRHLNAPPDAEALGVLGPH